MLEEVLERVVVDAFGVAWVLEERADGLGGGGPRRRRGVAGLGGCR